MHTWNLMYVIIWSDEVLFVHALQKSVEKGSVVLTSLLALSFSHQLASYPVAMHQGPGVCFKCFSTCSAIRNVTRINCPRDTILQANVFIASVLTIGAAPRPNNLGLKSYGNFSQLALCPPTPNCISTSEAREWT